jgi:hypothetical protein
MAIQPHAWAVGIRSRPARMGQANHLTYSEIWSGRRDSNPPTLARLQSAITCRRASCHETYDLFTRDFRRPHYSAVSQGIAAVIAPVAMPAGVHARRSMSPPPARNAGLEPWDCNAGSISATMARCSAHCATITLHITAPSMSCASPDRLRQSRQPHHSGAADVASSAIVHEIKRRSGSSDMSGSRTRRRWYSSVSGRPAHRRPESSPFGRTDQGLLRGLRVVLRRFANEIDDMKPDEAAPIEGS